MPLPVSSSNPPACFLPLAFFGLGLPVVSCEKRRAHTDEKKKKRKRKEKKNENPCNQNGSN
jgi:hypothetical protein